MNSDATLVHSIHRVFVQPPLCRIEQDFVSVEEPLELRLAWTDSSKQPQQISLNVTMRTPGEDRELALGFLYAEDIIQNIDQVTEITSCGPMHGHAPYSNVIKVSLGDGFQLPARFSARHFLANSSCGLCGKTSLAAVDTNTLQTSVRQYQIPATCIVTLPSALRAHQERFAQSGGLHACALFNVQNECLILHEDIGRHNALDKLIGSLISTPESGAGPKILVLSGRASFELIHKAIKAGLDFVVAVGAPSSFAVKLALTYGVTLVGFTKVNSFNIYAHPERISMDA